MTMVSQYFAEVGVGLDMKSLRSTQAYFKRIERTMLNFKRRVEKQQSVTFRAGVDRASMLKSLQVSANRLAKSVIIPLNRFHVNQNALVRAFNKAVSTSKFTREFSIGLRVSSQSLAAMRQQIRSALEGTIIRPRINPKIVGGRGVTSVGSQRVSDGNRYLDPRNTKRMSPWHNPMMIGGGAGAFLRYGMFSLPFVAGAIGLNSLNTFASTQQAQKTSLDMVSDMSTTGRTGDDNRAFLRDLAQRIGKTSMGMTPIYTQMLAASTGTELESKMPEMFSGLMQYASVMGLGEESIKRAMTGFNILLRAIY